MNCKCKVKLIIADTDTIPRKAEHVIDYCPMHMMAPVMLDILKAQKHFLPGDENKITRWIIARAEGKDIPLSVQEEQGF